MPTANFFILIPTCEKKERESFCSRQNLIAVNLLTIVAYLGMGPTVGSAPAPSLDKGPSVGSLPGMRPILVLPPPPPSVPAEPQSVGAWDGW